MTVINLEDSNIQWQLLDSQGTSIDYNGGFSNQTNQSNITISNMFGIGKLWTCQFHNTGTRDLVGAVTLNNTYYMYFMGDTFTSDDFSNFSPNLNILRFSSLILLNQQTLKCNMICIPIISKITTFNLTGIIYLQFYPYNPTERNFLNISINFNLTISGSIGKKFNIDIDNSTGNSVIIVTPDENIISTLLADEYLIVYFEIDQSNIEKQIVILEKDEKPWQAIIENLNYDDNPQNNNAHKILDNGNIFLRYRPYLNNEQDSYYILGFKCADPITIIAYQRDGCLTGITTSGGISANLKIIYADENQIEQIENIQIQAQSEQDRDSFPIPTASNIVSIPITPNLKYINPSTTICPTEEDRLGSPLSFNSSSS